MIQVVCTGLECVDHWGDDEKKSKYAFDRTDTEALDYWKMNNERGPPPPTVLGCLCNEHLSNNFSIMVYQEAANEQSKKAPNTKRKIFALYPGKKLHMVRAYYLPLEVEVKGDKYKVQSPDYHVKHLKSAIKAGCLSNLQFWECRESPVSETPSSIECRIAAHLKGMYKFCRL